MAQRRIGQESFRFDAKPGRETSLCELVALIDFAPAERALACLNMYKSGFAQSVSVRLRHSSYGGHYGRSGSASPIMSAVR